MNYLLIILLGLIFTNQVGSWNSECHMIVAQIAYNYSNSTVMEIVNSQSKIYYNFYPAYSDNLSVSTWPDFIKEDNIEYFSTWHYIDTPYNPFNISNVINASDINIIWAMKQINDSYIKRTDSFNYGLSIRFLIHLVGDIHQPMHNINLFSPEYPNGDNGGNKFIIKYNNETTNLHMFWDNCGDLYTSLYTFPLNESAIESIKIIANEIINDYSEFGPINLYDYDFEKWSQESYDVAARYAYGPVLNNNTITNNYVNQTRNLCKYQLYIAGFRLASLFNYLFFGE